MEGDHAAEEHGADTMDEESEGPSIHSAYVTFVGEASKILELSSQIGSNAEADSIVSAILDKYQEQCQLLDPHLESIINVLFNPIKGSTVSTGRSEKLAIHRACKVIYSLCKVRGFKTVIKFFPHEVTDLEPCLNLLSDEDPNDLEKWFTRYVLQLWLSILVMVPFGLETIDSRDCDAGIGLIDRILSICKFSLSESAKTRDAAAYLLAMMLTRPDLESSYLVSFLQWCREHLASKPSSFLSAGIYSALANIFKHGQRRSMLDKVPIILDVLQEQDQLESGKNSLRTALQRKLICKLAQRLGLTYVPVRVAAWRYQRGCRSLLENLKGSQKAESAPPTDNDQTESATLQNSPVRKSEAEVIEDDSYVPAEIDYIFDQMLRALSDRDTVVRWSGAKGIGRLTGRLPCHLADEVVEAVLQLFEGSEGDQDSAWHGGCLALAELARRGLLLPARLSQVVPFVVQALRYDVRKGSASVGAHVRDAACYVCWAFARAYAPSVMEPYIHDLAKALIIASVYDREINCRRAASAAFQENVGRQGTFPHGIDILTRADYYTLGNRPNAFLEISVYIAQYVEYRFALVDYLVQVQIRHWDKSVRALSAGTLRLLTKIDPAHVVGKVLNALTECSLSSDLPTRHGCTLAIAECVLGLSDAGHSLDAEWHERLIDVVPQIEKARLYRGRGGEIMRGASCRVIEALSLGGISLSQKSVARLMESVDENLKHPTEDIQQAAVSALRAVARRCFPAMMGAEWRGRLVKKYLSALSDPNPAVRRGFALALGALDSGTLDAHLGAIVSALVQAATVIQERSEDRDAESRRNAVRGLIDACRTAGLAACHGGRADAAGGGLGRARADQVFDGLVLALDDYCADHRGDVGSWVREAAMRALGEFCGLLADADAEAADPRGGPAQEPLLCGDKARRLVCALLKQLGEKIDRVRQCAGEVLHGLVGAERLRGRLGAEDAPLLREAILRREAGGAEPDWSAPSVTFPRLAALLGSPTFLRPVLAGMVVSLGGLTESLSRHAWEALRAQLERRAPAGAGFALGVAGALLDILERHHRTDRVTVPLLKTLALLASGACLDAAAAADAALAGRAAALVRAELRGSRDVSKLQAGASALCALLSLPAPGSAAGGGGGGDGGAPHSAREACLRALLGLLGHRFPKVRKHVAEQLYMQVLLREDLAPAESLGEVMEVLSEVDWFQEGEGVAARKDDLYRLFDLAREPAAASEPSPSAAAAAAAAGRAAAAAADGAGYKDLVKEMHF